MTKRLSLLTVLAIATLVLAGCSPAPNRDELVERFGIELSSSGLGEPADWNELSQGLADDALDGKCESELYRNGLRHADLVYAWDTTCLMYFEDDMTQSQIDRAKLGIIGKVAEDFE